MIGYCRFCENLYDTDLESSMTTMKIAIAIKKLSNYFQTQIWRKEVGKCRFGICGTVVIK